MSTPERVGYFGDNFVLEHIAKWPSDIYLDSYLRDRAYFGEDLEIQMARCSIAAALYLINKDRPEKIDVFRRFVQSNSGGFEEKSLTIKPENFEEVDYLNRIYIVLQEEEEESGYRFNPLANIGISAFLDRVTKEKWRWDTYDEYELNYDPILPLNTRPRVSSEGLI